MASYDSKSSHLERHSMYSATSYDDSQTCWATFSNAHMIADDWISRRPISTRDTKIHTLRDKTKAFRIPAVKTLHQLHRNLHLPNQFAIAHTTAPLSKRRCEYLFRLFQKLVKKQCKGPPLDDYNQSKTPQGISKVFETKVL